MPLTSATIMQAQTMPTYYITPNKALFEEMVRRIRKVGNPQKIILFGSQARGDARPDSDIDLLIIEQSSEPRYKRAAKYFRALLGTFPGKDIVVWAPEEVAEWAHIPNTFIATALREGTTLYER